MTREEISLLSRRYVQPTIIKENVMGENCVFHHVIADKNSFEGATSEFKANRFWNEDTKATQSMEEAVPAVSPTQPTGPVHVNFQREITYTDHYPHADRMVGKSICAKADEIARTIHNGGFNKVQILRDRQTKQPKLQKQNIKIETQDSTLPLIKRW